MKTASVPEKTDLFLGEKHVGTMAPYRRSLTAFQYSPSWLQDGYAISPFSLPLKPGVQIPRDHTFSGLFGIFAGSLPDGWGRLLTDRMLQQRGIPPETVGPLERLSLVGRGGMGALEYRPAEDLAIRGSTGDLDLLAAECRKILGSEKDGDAAALLSMSGFSGGARPKIILKDSSGEWLVKFPSSRDPENIGQMEYDYNLCARECGIEIPEIRLFPSGNSPGYFGVRRFDRIPSGSGIRKVHMATVSALLEVSHRYPSLDYSSLMALTWQLTRQADQVLRMFRLMCFNIFAHNRDDHSSNFSFLHDGAAWRLAPAYDLTWSSSLGGEHATTVAGEGRNPGMEQILQIARSAGIRETKARQMAEEIREKVMSHLAGYLKN